MNKKILADFFRHFSQLLGSGERLLDALAKCRKHSYMKEHSDFVDYLAATVKDGKNFGVSLLDIGFPRDYIGYFNVGEWEGRLDQTTAELAKALEKDSAGEPEIDLKLPAVDRAQIEAGEEKIARLVDSWIRECAEAKASDLHIIPVKGYGAVIKYRVNGVLRETGNIDRETQLNVVARVKHMACLDIAEKRLPQDGRVLIRVGDRDLDLRVSVVPVFLGEKITVRFLVRSDVVIGLEKICFSEQEMKTVREMLDKPYGMIFVTGMSGSGKTTTCYSILNDYIKKGCNVVTIEHPFEYLLNGGTQIALDPSIGLDNIAALRAALRTDPDVIFVGEFPDKRVIDIAVRAAQTGHVVICQFAARNIRELIETLVLMEGLETSMMANILNGAISQALLRRLCECKKKIKSVPAAAKKLGLKSVHQSVGCQKCLNSGYKGRIPVYEIVIFDHDLKEAIAAADVKKAGKLVTTSLEKKALALVEKGITSLEEVHRVFGMNILAHKSRLNNSKNVVK